MPVPKGYYATTGMRPSGTGTADFGVSVRDLRHYERNGPKWKLHAAKLIPETLRAPGRIFHDLRREGMEEAFCYAGVPSGRWISEGIEGPFPPGRVFLVFVMEKHWGYVVLDWESREADPDSPDCPIGWNEDFGNPIWPKT